MRKTFTLLLVSVLFAPLFFLPATGASAAGSQSFYLLSLVWDSEKNTLASAGGGDAAVLSSQNILKDTGSGSQFYARVINFENKPEAFKKGVYKIFLGQWKLDGDSKKGEVKISIPYFENGSKVVIFNAKDKKTALSVDVSKMAKRKSASGKSSAAKAAVKTPAAAGATTYQIGGHSPAYWWTMRVLALLILGGGGYFIWRWRKKKKMMQAGAPVANLTQSQKK